MTPEQLLLAPATSAARRSDPMTSVNAAKSVKRSTCGLAQNEIIRVLGKRGPLMAWEICEELAHIALSDSRIRTALTELERCGLIEVVGEGTTPYGRSARIWKLV